MRYDTMKSERAKSIICVLMVLLSGIIPLFFMYGFFDPFSIPKRAAADFLISLILLAITGGFISGRLRIKLCGGHYLLFVFILFALLSLHGAPDKYYGLRSIMLYVNWLVVAVAGYQITREREVVKPLLTWIAVFSLLVGLMGFYEIFTHSSPFINISEWGGRTSSTLGAPTLYSGYILLSIFIAQGGMLLRREMKHRLLFGIVWTVMVVNLFHTGTVSAWAAFIIANMFFTFCVLKLWMVRTGGDAGRRLVIPVIALVLITGAVLFSGRQKIHNVFNDKFIKNKTQSMDMRYRRWDAAWNMFEAKPVLGVGSGMFGAYYPEYVEHSNSSKVEADVRYPENLLFLLLSENGAMGLFSFALLFVYTMFVTIKTVMRGGKGALQALGFGCAVIAVTIYSMFHYPLHTEGVWALYWFCVAGVWGAGEMNSASHLDKLDSEKKKVSITSAGSMMLVAAAIFIAVAGFVFSATFVAKEHYLYRAFKEMENNRIQPGMHAVNRALVLTGGKDWSTRMMAGFLCEKSNKNSEAYDHLSVASSFQPNNLDIYSNMFNVVDKEKNRERAIEILDKMISISPQALKYYMLRADQYEKMGRYSEAVHDLEFYIGKIEHKSWREYYMLFMCLARLENRDGIKERYVLNQVLAFGPDYYLPYYQMGMMYMSSGNHEKAVTMMNRALELNPDFEPAVHALEELRK